MTVPPESHIRDHLADNVELVEPGLRLIEKEHYLPNVRGGRGFIDLLCRDDQGCYVVIEIKRSDDAARTAIHELYKYTQLLRQNHGLAAHDVRCVLVSTSWHELLVPFSAFARNSEYHAEGLKLELTLAGSPGSASKVELLPQDDALETCPHQVVFLYRTGVGRDQHIPNVQAALTAASIVDYFLLIQDYAGSSPSVIFPFAITLVTGAVMAECRLRMELELEPDSVDTGDEWWAEEELQRAVIEAVDCDSLELSTPVRFGVSLPEWPIAQALRAGRFTSSIRSDTDLSDLAEGSGGPYTIGFSATIRPRFSARWRHVRESLNHVLLGNERWSKLLNAVLDDVEHSRRSDRIKIYVYNPLDILFALFKLVSEGERGYLPGFAVRVLNDNDDVVDGYAGALAWNLVTTPESVDDMLRVIFGAQDLMAYGISRSTSDLWRHEDRILNYHGLTCEVFRVSMDNETLSFRQLWIGDGGRVEYMERETDDPAASLRAFLDRNRDYLEEWSQRFQQIYFEVQ
jgi:hypothetical protein